MMIWFVDGLQELICKILSYVQGMLLQYLQFVRVYCFFIVNIECIDCYVCGKGGFVVMECGMEISVANSKKMYLAIVVEQYFGVWLQ